VVDESFLCQCISDTINGLREGLCLFSGLIRVALIYALAPDDSMRVFDPQNLLEGHEPKFKELYMDSDKWRSGVKLPKGKKHLVWFTYFEDKKVCIFID